MKTIQKSKKILAALCAVALVVSCMAIGAVAATSSQTIQALLSFGTPIKYNGQVQTFKDANGKQVFPILYEGTTYLPVRAVCGMVGVAVDYDAATSTVILGEKDKTPVPADIVKGDSRTFYTSDPGYTTVDGVAYATGILFKDIDTADNKSTITLNGKWSVLHCLIQNTGDSSVEVQILDAVSGNVIKVLPLTAGSAAQAMDLPVSGVQTLSVRVHNPNLFSKDGQLIMTDMYLK